MHDLHKAVLSSKVTCVADDTKVLKRVDSQQDSVDLQSDIDNLKPRAAFNGLTFNDSNAAFETGIARVDMESRRMTSVAIVILAQYFDMMTLILQFVKKTIILRVESGDSK